MLLVLTGADAVADKLGAMTAHLMPEDFGAPKGYRTFQPLLVADARALRRRPRRLRRRRDPGAGARRRRAGRGRLRAAAGGGESRRCRQARRAQGLGRQSERQQRVPADVRRPGRDRCGLRQGQARRQAAGREQPAVAGGDGAARRHRRLQRRRGFHHALHGFAKSARRAHGDSPRLPRAGEPDPRGLARRRRRLRPQGRAVSRRSAGAVGGAQAAPAGEMARHPLARACRPTITAARWSITANSRSTSTARFSACAPRACSRWAPISSARRSPPARSRSASCPRPTTSRPCTSCRRACSPTPRRAGPIAAPGGRRRPISWSG